MAARKPKAPAYSHAPAGTMRFRIESVLIYAFRRTEAAGFVGAVPLADIARDTGLPPPLVAKIAKHLEAHGMLELDQGGVDLTVGGMLEAESMQQPPAAKAAAKKA